MAIRKTRSGLLPQDYTTNELRADANKYLAAQRFLVGLRKYYLHRRITGAQYSELRNMALEGELGKAEMELAEVIDLFVPKARQN